MAALRIDGTYRAATSTRSASARATGTGSAFQLGDEAVPARSAGPAEMAGSPTIDSLLALQSVEDPLLKRKKAVRRGTALLDALDAIKADLLGGRVGEGRLNTLMAMIGQVREGADPRLDSLLDDIELRARVELAKFGLYPGAQ